MPPNSPSSSQIIEKIISFCCSGKKAQFLDTLPEPLSKNTAGADRIECLQRLEALAGRIGFRIEPRHDTCETEIQPFDALQLLDTENYTYNCECSNSSYDEKWFVLRTRHKQHQDRNSQHDNRRAQVVGDFPDTKNVRQGNP